MLGQMSIWKCGIDWIQLIPKQKKNMSFWPRHSYTAGLKVRMWLGWWAGAPKVVFLGYLQVPFRAFLALFTAICYKGKQSMEQKFTHDAGWCHPGSNAPDFWRQSLKCRAPKTWHRSQAIWCHPMIEWYAYIHIHISISTSISMSCQYLYRIYIYIYM